MTKFTLLFVVLFAGSVFSQTTLDSGLVAYYPFNGNADDESGNGNHGSVIGAVLTTDREGNDSSAYEFDGVSSYISIPNSESLASPDSELTQIAWINIYSWSLVGTAFGPVLMKSNSGVNSFQYRLSVGDGGINTAIRDWGNAVTIFDTLKTNQWYMVASTLKGDTVWTYLDGVFIGKGTLTGPAHPDNYPLEIGRDVPGSVEVFHGKIDDVHIYDRALSNEEIMILSGNSTGLVRENQSLPVKFSLAQNYPNPFNPVTTFEVSLLQAEFVTLVLYNSAGQEVATLVAQELAAGIHRFRWHAGDLASGVYICRARFGNVVVTRKAVLIK